MPSEGTLASRPKNKLKSNIVNNGLDHGPACAQHRLLVSHFNVAPD